jgi:CBS domain-containing protein
METVRQLLRGKGHQVWSVSPDDTVYHALELMAEKNIGAVLVTEGDDIVGIMSERDYARKVILKGKFSKDTPVREIMTERVLFVTPDHTVRECLALMTQRRFRHLPVMDQGKLAGLISIGDVVKALIADQEFTIEQLENYITGQRA